MILTCIPSVTRRVFCLQKSWVCLECMTHVSTNSKNRLQSCYNWAQGKGTLEIQLKMFSIELALCAILSQDLLWEGHCLRWFACELNCANSFQSPRNHSVSWRWCEPMKGAHSKAWSFALQPEALLSAKWFFSYECIQSPPLFWGKTERLLS